MAQLSFGHGRSSALEGEEQVVQLEGQGAAPKLDGCIHIFADLWQLEWQLIR